MPPIQERITDPEENIRLLKEMEARFYGSEVKKTDADTGPATPAYSTAPDWVQPVFGRRIWSYLNYEKNALAIIPKAPWRNSGWRMLTGAAADWTHDNTAMPGGVARAGALPDTIKVTPVIQSTQPKEIMHTWGVQEIDQFLSSVDDSVEIVPEMRAELGREHAMLMNTMVIQSIEPLAGGAAANNTGTNNIESLDRIISADAEEDGLGGTHINWYDPWVQYALTAVDRDSGTTYDAKVVSCGSINTDGDLTLSKVNQLWRQIIEAGGNVDVILTGLDFVDALSEILEPERRFIGEARMLPRYGGVTGLQAPGVEAGFSVATYKGTPIVTTAQMRNTDATYGDTISKAMLLDTRFLELRTVAPTRYMETSRTYDAYAAQNKLRIEGGYYTVAELICYRFNVQGKLRDIK